jgi:uncharacterized membrane protein
VGREKMIRLNKTEIFILLIIVIYMITAYFLYPLMPAMIATHWNISGVADDYSSRLFGVLIMPVFFVILFIIYYLFSRSNILKNTELKKQLDVTIILSVLFIFFVSILSLIYNIGIHFNMSLFMIPATSVLFITLGIILKDIKKRNLFFGIRTPWTLVDDVVWRKTHKLGGRLFIIFGIINLFAMLYLEYFTMIFLVSIIGILLITFIYSYIVYKKEKK